MCDIKYAMTDVYRNELFEMYPIENILANNQQLNTDTNISFCVGTNRFLFFVKIFMSDVKYIR